MSKDVTLRNLDFDEIPEVSSILVQCWKYAYKDLINDEYLSSLNALVYAINSDGDERLSAIHDALSIRHARRSIFHTVYEENLSELSEGTAVYTELHLVFSRNEIEAIIQIWPELLMEFESAFHVLTYFGYYAGALYGILLDDFDVNWRPYVEYDTDLGLMLQDALGITEMIPFYEIDLERYGYSEITKRVELKEVD